ncbi:MAG: hypothetical protein RLZZ546_763 [Bacteroidota bacterium]|jgi:hypothetical protein
MVTNKKRISFDFDNTLDLDWVQINLFAPLSHIYEILIITSRSSEKENKSVWELAEVLGVPKENIFFTNHQPKAEWVDKLECVMHFDDDFIEVTTINESCNCKALLVNYLMNSYEKSNF